MEESNEKQFDFMAFTPDPLEDLTIQDALIISAVHAVQADPKKCKRISTLAQKHPLFVEKPENTAARVNKYVNLMQGGKSVKAVEAVTNYLNPEHRQQAFEFASEAALEDKELTNDKKKTLTKLAIKLALDNEFVEQKLATIQDKSLR
jgi:hypothetical protein